MRLSRDRRGRYLCECGRIIVEQRSDGGWYLTETDSGYETRHDTKRDAVKSLVERRVERRVES